MSATTAWEVAVKLNMHSNMGALFGALTSHLRKAEGEVAGFSKKTSLLMSGAFAAAGVGMLAALKGPYEEAKKLAQAQADFQTLNLSAADNAAVAAKAATLSHKVLGTTITENVKNIQDLHTAFGDLHHAMASAEAFAKFNVVAKVMNDGHPVEGLIGMAAKALEHRGQKVMGNDVAFNDELGMMEKVYAASKGRVGPADFFHASQTGKLAYSLMDKEELYGPFAAYMSTKSGSTAGTSAMTFASSMIGGHMDNKGKGFLSELNLWEEGVSPKRLKLMQEATKGLSKGEMKSLGYLEPLAGGLKSEYLDMATHQQSKFIQEVMAPAIRRRFGMDLSDEQVATLLMQHLNRNSAGFSGDYILNAIKFKKDAAIFDKTKTGDSLYQHYLKSPEGAEEAAGAAWTNFLTMFGSVYLPTITKGMLSLANGLDSLSQWMTAHPTLTKVLVDGFIALGAAMAIGGTLNLVRLGFSGITGVLGLAGGAGLVGVLGKAGLAGAASFAIVEVGRLGIALADLFNIKTRDGVALSPGSSARLLDPDTRAKLAQMDADFKGGNRNFVPGGGSGQMVQVTTKTYLDGRSMANTISMHQAKSMAGNLGSGTYDLGLSQPSVNLRTN